MDIDVNSIEELFKLGGILAALIHFAVGFIMYRDMLRINKVIKTNSRGLFTLISNGYILFLLAIVIVFIII